MGELGRKEATNIYEYILLTSLMRAALYNRSEVGGKGDRVIWPPNTFSRLHTNFSTPISRTTVGTYPTSMYVSQKHEHSLKPTLHAENRIDLLCGIKKEKKTTFFKRIFCIEKSQVRKNVGEKI